jgi:hypothetical protein
VRGPIIHSGGALLVLALSACPSLPDLEWEGEHVRFGADNPELVCGGTLEYLDHRAGQLKARVGATHTIDYYWLPDGVNPLCPGFDKVGGCAVGDEVFSTWVPHQHELVHTMSSMPYVLAEGLATHWGDSRPQSSMASREWLHEQLMGGADDISNWHEYARAAHFMAYLSETHGWESLVHLDASLDYRSRPKDIERAIFEVYGVSPSELLAAYDEYPDCDGIVDVSFACEGEPVRLGFDQPEFQRVVDCSSETAMGPYDGMVFVEDVIELSPSIGGSRIIWIAGDAVEKGGFALLRRCAPCSENGVFVLRGLYFLSDEMLPADRYVVQFHLPIEAGPALFEISING